MTGKPTGATLSVDNVLQIKFNLWNGEPQSSVARMFNCSQSNISHIMRGRVHYAIPWPDGSVGPMPTQRLAELYAAAKGASYVSPVSRNLSPNSTNPSSLELHPAAGSHQNVRPQLSNLRPMPIPVDRGSDYRERASNEQEGSVEVNQQTQLTPNERADMLNSLAEQADQDMQNELIAIMQAVPLTEPVREAKAREQKPPSYEFMSWNEITTKAADLPIVIAAESDPDLQTCVRAAFKLIPRSRWGSPMAIKLIHEIALTLGLDLERTE